MDKDDISLCVFCHCMTHTVECGFCGKCGAEKELAKDGVALKDGTRWYDYQNFFNRFGSKENEIEYDGGAEYDFIGWLCDECRNVRVWAMRRASVQNATGA